MKYRTFPGTDLSVSEIGFGGEQMARVAELATVNFGVDEEPMSYKGTMERVAS